MFIDEKLLIARKKDSSTNGCFFKLDYLSRLSMRMKVCCNCTLEKLKALRHPVKQT